MVGPKSKQTAGGVLRMHERHTLKRHRFILSAAAGAFDQDGAQARAGERRSCRRRPPVSRAIGTAVPCTARYGLEMAGALSRHGLAALTRPAIRARRAKLISAL
jgi:hypothetical protein